MVQDISTSEKMVCSTKNARRLIYHDLCVTCAVSFNHPIIPKYKGKQTTKAMYVVGINLMLS